MLRKSFAATFVLSLVLVSGCGSGGGLVGLMSQDEEWQLGNQMAAQVAQQTQLSNDAEALAYVTRMGERIHAATPLADRPFHFYIVNDPNVNAFSLPGGHIYINSGAIATAGKADELAGIMAHEISHVVARHVARQISQQQSIGLIGALVLGQNPTGLQQLVAQVVAGGAMARFSRADEKQADDLGLEYMAAAGYNPQGMLDFFQKLLALGGGNANGIDKFFADHPGTNDRIKDIQGRLSKMNITSNLIVDELEFRNVRTHFAK